MAVDEQFKPECSVSRCAQLQEIQLQQTPSLLPLFPTEASAGFSEVEEAEPSGMTTSCCTALLFGLSIILVFITFPFSMLFVIKVADASTLIGAYRRTKIQVVSKIGFEVLRVNYNHFKVSLLLFDITVVQIMCLCPCTYSAVFPLAVSTSQNQG